MNNYRLIARRAEGLVSLNGPCGPQLWGTRKLRKVRGCASCSERIKVGERAFAPFTNALNRMERLCVTCVDGAS